MANQILTYDEFLNSGKPFPEGTAITIADSSNVISNLTVQQIAELNSNNVVSIDITDDTIQLQNPAALAILDTNISFADADQVTVTDGKNGGAFTAQQIGILSAKHVDFIAPAFIQNSATADIAAAVAASDIRYREDDLTVLSDTGDNISGLSTAVLAKLLGKGFDVIDAQNDVLKLSFDQYAALQLADIPPKSPENPDSNPVLVASAAASLMLTDGDTVTLELSSSQLSALSGDQVAAFKTKGIDVLDGVDDNLALTVDQYNALGTVRLTASDTVSLADTGTKLSALSAAQISALGAEGIDMLDATDRIYTLSLAQYQALGSLKLSADDVVTISADADATLSNGGNKLTLTGNAVRGTGNGLANTLTGNAKNNILAGLEGNDFLNGGLGNDQLNGGAGRDVFVFDTKTNKSTNVDKIIDFKSKDDSFYLDNRVFTKLSSGTLANPKKFASDMFVEGTKAKDKEDRIVYDKKTGSLYYDADGTGKSAQVKIATVSNKEKLFYHDFFVI